MARRICQSLLVVAIAYALAIAVFALVHYEAKDRPGVLGATKEFHLWIVGRLPSKEPAPTPGAVPPPPPPPPPAPPPPPEPVVEDPRVAAIRTVEKDLLPKARAQMAEIPKASGDDRHDKKAEARKTLVEARDLLGPLLDRKRDDPEVQALYQEVSERLIAVSKG